MSRLGPLAQQFLAAVHAYGLADRYPEIRQYLYLAQSGKLSEGMARALLMAIEPLILELERCPSTLPLAGDQNELGRFDVELGELIENPGTRIGIRLLDGPRHIIVFGTTGSGKTTLERQIIHGVDGLGRGIPIIVFCFKRDLLHLGKVLGRDHWDTYSPWAGYRQGTRAPGNLPASIWFNQVAKILAARCGLIMSATCLASIMRFAFAALNDPPGSQILWPSLPMVFEIAQRAPLECFASKPDYAKTLLQALEGLLGSSGHLFDTLTGFDVIEHVVKPGRSCVIDLSMVPVQVSAIVVETVLSQLLSSRMYARHTVDTTEVLVVIDEADALTSAQTSAVYPEGYSPLGECVKRSREFGVELCVSVSFISQANPFIRANMDTFFAMSQTDHHSIIEAARTLRIPPGGEGQLTALQPGECIYRSARGPCSFPMLAQIDYLPPSREHEMPEYDAVPHVPDKRIEELPRLMRALDKLIAEHRATKLRQSESKLPTLSKNARKLLDLASLHPHVPVNKLWEEAGVASYSVRLRVRADLKGKELAVVVDERFGRRNAQLIEITDAGFRALRKDPPSHTGGGGITHRHIAAWCCLWARRQGYKAQTEVAVPGTNHRADAAYEHEGKLHVFEVISTSEENLTDHLHACFVQSKAVATVTIVAAQKSILNRLEKVISQDAALQPFLDRVRYMPVENLMKELWP